MDKKATKKFYSEEFRREAVELANNIGFMKAAAKLGVHDSSIRGWKKIYEGQTGPTPTGQSKKTYAELEKEIKRLAKENGYLKEINRVLKKSTAIFSSDQMGNFK